MARAFHLSNSGLCYLVRDCDIGYSRLVLFALCMIRLMGSSCISIRRLNVVWYLAVGVEIEGKFGFLLLHQTGELEVIIGEPEDLSSNYSRE